MKTTTFSLLEEMIKLMYLEETLSNRDGRISSDSVLDICSPMRPTLLPDELISSLYSCRPLSKGLPTIP